MKNNKILAIDFDGTVVDHEFPKIGRLKPYAKEALTILKEEGFVLILWTCRDGQYLEDAKEFLDINNIYIDYFNENADYLDFKTSEKIYADMYIDDRNFGGFPGWDKIVANLAPNRLRNLLGENYSSKPIFFFDM